MGKRNPISVGIYEIWFDTNILSIFVIDYLIRIYANNIV